MDVCVGGSLSGWINGCVDGLLRVSGWMDGSKAVLMSFWINAALHTVRSPFRTSQYAYLTRTTRRHIPNTNCDCIWSGLWRSASPEMAVLFPGEWVMADGQTHRQTDRNTCALCGNTGCYCEAAAHWLLWLLVCFVQIWEQTANIYLCIINWLVFITGI